MQDIDFDEIDRAVGSMAHPRAADVVTRQADPSLSPELAAAEGSDETVTDNDTEQSLASTAPHPSSGRFMDVVHPSSDMRPTRSSAPFAPSLHREEVAERDEIVSLPEPTAATSSAFHWPDPIDLVETTLVVEPVVEPTSEPAVVPELASMPDQAPVLEITAPELVEPAVEPKDFEEDDTSPLESPFLSDTKVEKRPLGAFSGADAELPLLEDPIPFSGGSFTAPTPVIQPEEPTHEEHVEMPQELHADLLSLDGHSKDAVEEEPLLEAANPQPEVTTTATTETVPAGPTSITQQYTEQPRTDSQPSGSIFDTEAYHQPIAHPVKKRSGLFVLVWIVALVIVGGGIGAGIYYFILPMLG